MSRVVIAEKTSQARDIDRAVGGDYGKILPAEGHLLSLASPGEVNGEWLKWSYDLLWSGVIYPTRTNPAGSPSGRRKLAAIATALASADEVTIATDCDREGQLIGEELLRHHKFRGRVFRVMFTATDPATIRAAFAARQANDKYFCLGQSAVARQQADQIYNLTLTRAATLALRAPGQQNVIGIGRVKTPTLAIACIREREIKQFRPVDYYDITGLATTAEETLLLTHVPKPPLTDMAAARAIADKAADRREPLKVKQERKRRSPPKLLDLPALQKAASSRWGIKASTTLDIAQSLYDRHKITTYPRAESRHLAENQISDVGRIVAGLLSTELFGDVEIPTPVIRKGKKGIFCDKCLEGIGHHAIIPNVNLAHKLAGIIPRLNPDEKKLFGLIASSFLASVMADYEYNQTTVVMNIDDYKFAAVGQVPINLGWRAVLDDGQKEEKTMGKRLIRLPPVSDGEQATLSDIDVNSHKTKAPPRFNEGSLIDAMQNAWKYVEDDKLALRLKEAKGIGTPATRAGVIDGLLGQGFLTARGKNIVPTEGGMKLYGILRSSAPDLVNPAITAGWELKMDLILTGQIPAMDVIQEVAAAAAINTKSLRARENDPGCKIIPVGGHVSRGAGRPPSAAQIKWVKKISAQRNIKPPAGWKTEARIASTFLEKQFKKKGDRG